MELVWTKEIGESNFIHYDYHCKPFVFDNKLYYAHRDIDPENKNSEGIYGTIVKVTEVNLSDLSSSIKQISFNDKELKNKEVLLTDYWRFIRAEEKLYLYVGFLLDISKPVISIADLNFTMDEFKVRTEYDFGDKCLKYNQQSTIECFDKQSNTKIWKVIIKGFIYTEIELKNDCLLFGTAGKGGAFYCINLDTGQVLTEHINNDSSNYEWQNNSVILKDKKGNMQQINPFTGEALQTLVLKDKLFYAPILADNQYIYTTAYNKKSNSGRLICVLNDDN